MDRDLSSATVSLVDRFIDRPCAGAADWARRFDHRSLPVLARSAALLEDLREHEESVDAHSLADAFSSDPLMCLKVLAHVAELRRGKEGSDPETLTAALVMLGITPFFQSFGPQATVEAHLEHRPEAMAGFSRVLARSHRAAAFALAFAVQRLDHDAGVIRDAALLHDFAELLMWLYAPSLMCSVTAMLKADSTLRSAVAQKCVLNVPLPELQHLLMEKWRLPRLLVDIADDHREGTSTQARNVYLAIRLARHTEVDWNNAGLADDVKDIASLLNLGLEPTMNLLKDIDGVDS